MHAFLAFVHLMFGGVFTNPSIADRHYITCYTPQKVCAYKLVKTQRIIPAKPLVLVQTFKLDVPQY